MGLSKTNKLLLLLLSVVAITGTILAFQITKHDRAGAIGDVSQLSAREKVAFSETKGYEAKTPAKLGDWLYHHKETGQTYAQYLRSRPNMPSRQRNVIYILPLGEFGKDAPSLDVLLEYTKAYYTPMKVKMLDPVKANMVKAKSRMNGGVKQWNSLDILKWLKHRLPRDAYAMQAVTMTDLYPSEKWNFVFGQASFKQRVGVFSFARYGGSEDMKLAQLRAGKVLTHEFGHMFGVRHCIHYQCNMNGANHLQEMDQTPVHLCPICLRKLHHAIKFDPVKRYETLQAYYKKHKLEEEEKWVSERLKIIKAASEK